MNEQIKKRRMRPSLLLLSLATLENAPISTPPIPGYPGECADLYSSYPWLPWRMRPSLLLLPLATLASSIVLDYECSKKAGHFMNRLIDLYYIPLEDA